MSEGNDTIHEDVSDVTGSDKPEVTFADPPLDVQSRDDNGDTPEGGRDPGAPREPTERERRIEEIARMAQEHGNSLARVASATSDDDPDGADGAEDDDLGGGGTSHPGEQAQSTPAAAAAPKELEDLGFYRNRSGELVTKMKINGVEQEVPAAAVKAHLQKDLAGDFKLRQAADRERQLAEQERTLQQRAQQSQSLANRPPKMGAADAKRKAQELADRFWDGDAAPFVDTLASILERGEASTLDEEALLEKAQQRTLSAMERMRAEAAQAEWEASRDRGNAALAHNHPEIYSDPRLFAVVNDETARMVALRDAGDPDLANLTPEEIITKAAESVQEWLGATRRNAQSSGRGGGLPERQARKDGLKRMPANAGRKQETDPPAEKVLTTEETIAQIAASRAGARV